MCNVSIRVGRRHFCQVAPYLLDAVIEFLARGFADLRVVAAGDIRHFRYRRSSENSYCGGSFDEHRAQLAQRVSVVEQGLVRCGIRVAELGTEEIVELFYRLFNPGETEKSAAS